jgi:nucleotidyltransferase-like protein
MFLPKEKELTLNNIVNDLRQTENVFAVVLGGSYAAGVASENSDLDIGIYYSEERPFNIDDIKLIAKKYAVADDTTVTGFYEWGPWVNGGAWIETASGQVDFIYRNTQQVSRTIEKAKTGEWENHFEQQPPYGFTSMIYLGETNCCLPLYDPHQIIAKFKDELKTYPAKLKVSVVQQSLWSVEFTIWHAEYFYKKLDLYNLIGCLTRGVKYIVNALFAINELYPLGDKRAIKILQNAKKVPLTFEQRVEDILCADKHSVRNNMDVLQKLFDETVELSNVAYKRVYNLKKV